MKKLTKLILSLTLVMACFEPASTANYNKVASSDWFYDVRDFGAKGDGEMVDTKAIQETIEKAAKDGGGNVYFPAGKYISGTLFLRSNINIYLENGAILEGSKDLNDYPVTESKVRSYTDLYTNKSLIYAEGIENISITGKGTIDGNGASFMVDFIQNDDKIRKEGDFYKTRPFIIRMINCKNILLRDIKILNSPMWVQHYLFCEDVNIDGVTVNSQVNHNNDGIDIDGCNRVTISNCKIVSADDAIVIKSTLEKPSKNITVTNCLLSSNCCAFKLGTESNGGFQNISFSNCVIYDTRLSGIALEMVDGASLNNVSVSNINMDNVGCAIFVRLGNRARPFNENMPKPGMGSLYNVIIQNIQGTNIGKTGCSITGLPSYPVRNITLNNIRLSFKGEGTEDLIKRKIEEFPEKYPEFDMFGQLPAYGFYCRHVIGLEMEKIDLSYDLADYRPALYMQDVKDARISNLKASYEEGAKSIIVIDNSRDIFIKDCNTMKSIDALSTINNGSENIGFINNNIFSKFSLFKSDSTVKKSDIIIK